MKILFVTPTLPDRPDKDGMTQVAFRLIGELTKRHAITIWSLGEGESPTTASALGIRAIQLFPRHHRSLVSYYLFGSRVPYYQTRNECRALHTALQTLPDGSFDLVIIHSPFMGQYIADVQRTPVVVHAMDAMSSWFEKTALHEPHLLKKMHLSNEGRRARHVEYQQYRHARAVIFVSPADETIVKKILPQQTRTFSIPIGITLAEFYPPSSPRLPMTLLFSGVMDYPPNIDAVVWFTREIWPAIRSRFPEAQFRIVGKNPDRRVRELQRIPGIDIAGRVERISDELRVATIAISPLRFGTGFKIKAIEALACGAPLVATSETLSGYDLVHGKDVIIADDPESWIISLTDLLRHPHRRSSLSIEGLASAQRYAWPAVAHRYEDVYDIAIHG